MQTCATCQYWGHRDARRSSLPSVRLCGHPMLWAGRYSVEEGDVARTQAALVDGEAHAVLSTGPDFGCVQWRARELEVRDHG